MSYEIEKSWVTKAGLPAVVIWANNSHRCGYVELTQDSVFYKMTNEREIHTILQKNINNLYVHGGVTFFDIAYWSDPESEDFNFFVGFDCAHSGDAAWFNPNEGILRSLDYCIEQCEELAKQLMSINP